MCLFDNYYLILLSLLKLIFFYFFFWFFVLGIKNKFVVRIVGVGFSFLVVFIEGFFKCVFSCCEVDEGYEFSYMFFVLGKYFIIVKYGNINIVGSLY